MHFLAHLSLAIVIYQERLFVGIQEKSTSEIVLSSSKPDACFNRSLEKRIASPHLKPLADTLVSYTAVLKHRVQYDRVSSHPANKLRFGQFSILRER